MTADRPGRSAIGVPALDWTDGRPGAPGGGRPGPRSGAFGWLCSGLIRLLFACGVGWLLLLAFARWGTWTRPWPIELVDTFALYAFVPFLALVPAAILLRSRALGAVVVGATLFFVQQFGQAILPTPAAGATGGATLRVLTYNVYGRNADAGPLAELVRSVNPDVIVLQELRQAYAADLIRLVGDDYPFRIAAALNTPNDGSGTFSRVPIVDAQAFQLEDNGNAFQHLRLQVGRRELALFNVHLASPEVGAGERRGGLPAVVRGFDAPRRDRELAWLISETEQLSTPFVLAGDFNVAAGSRPYRQFPERWRDAFGERGSGFGHTFPARRTPWSVRFPAWFPLIRIDYILSSPEIVPGRAWVPWLDGSDHLPVVAELHVGGG